MAHGRKRTFLAGLLIGGVLGGLAACAVVMLLWLLSPETGQPRSPESARRTTSEWARLVDFPSDTRGFSIATEGSSFTRAFRVTFFGDPDTVDDWVKSCPGVADKNCKMERLDGGYIRYEIPAGGGAAYAELIHHRERGTVEIYTYWS